MLFFAFFIILSSPVLTHTHTHTHNHTQNHPTVDWSDHWSDHWSVAHSSKTRNNVFYEGLVPGLSSQVGIRLAEITVQKALPETVALQVTKLDASLTSIPSYSHACLQTHFHGICRAQIDSTQSNTSIILPS